MATTEHSELSYFRGLSLIELDRLDTAKALFESLQAFAEHELKKEASIDYFATSLPLLMVFEEDLNAVKIAAMTHLVELAARGIAACVDTTQAAMMPLKSYSVQQSFKYGDSNSKK